MNHELFYKKQKIKILSKEIYSSVFNRLVSSTIACPLKKCFLV
jgi:hypothetical protein